MGRTCPFCNGCLFAFHSCAGCGSAVGRPLAEYFGLRLMTFLTGMAIGIPLALLESLCRRPNSIILAARVRNSEMDPGATIQAGTGS